MNDQFSEWDKFYAAYEKSLTPERAFQKYRRGRKRRGKLPKKSLTPQQRMQMEYEMRVEKRRVEALELKASALVAESSIRASKTTTKG